MRKILAVLFAVALMVPVLAGAGPDVAKVFEGCTYWRSAAGATVTADTLWFSKTAPVLVAGTATAYAGTAGMDWLAPDNVPIGQKNDGTLIYDVRHVKRVLLYSRAPFTYKAFGALGAHRSMYDIADTNAQADPKSGDAFPCWAVLAYPDSVYVAEAGSDSVQVMIGF